MLQNKFAIGIPTLNRFDLLHPALLFYVNDFPNTQIYVVDNGNQNVASKISHPNITIIKNDWNVGVATSWNILCDNIFEKHDHAIILNDDIYLGKKEFEIDSILTSHKRDFYVATQDWCAFILPKKTYTKVGKFDDVFYPAYYEDNDYAYRMKLLGCKMFKIPFLNPYVYRASQTIEKDPTIKSGYIANKRIYQEKWGGNPNEEKFKTPYNGKPKQ